ncbi:hypothetical protein TrRE_jg9363, partial [Triparma retinervis]
MKVITSDDIAPGDNIESHEKSILPPSPLSSSTLSFISSACTIYDLLTSSNSACSVIASHSHLASASSSLSSLRLSLPPFESSHLDGEPWREGRAVVCALEDYVAKARSEASRKHKKDVEDYIKMGEGKGGDVRERVRDLATL